MSKTEINLKIAELLGYEVKIQSDGLPIARKLKRESWSINGWWTCPDYINDPVQREPLMMELMAALWTINYLPVTEQYIWIDLNGEGYLNKHFGIATCLAWLELKANE